MGVAGYYGVNWLRSVLQNFFEPLAVVGGAISGAGAAIGGGIAATSQNWGAYTQQTSQAQSNAGIIPSPVVPFSPVQAAVLQQATGAPIAITNPSQNPVITAVVNQANPLKGSTLSVSTKPPSLIVIQTFTANPPTAQQVVASGLGLKTSQINPLLKVSVPISVSKAKPFGY